MSVLKQILRTKATEVAERKRRVAEQDLLATPMAKRKRLSMRKALETSAPGIIAEFKRKSPSKGFIHAGADVQETVRGYAENGAAACSVLTDTEYFGGSCLDLALARSVVEIPLLRKDFIIDPYQLAESVAFGADAVLLIAAALTVEQCEELTGKAHEWGLEVLLEIHEEEELDHVRADIDMIGINNRNLATFDTDIYTSLRLADKIPPACLKVSESGIHTVDTLKALREYGFKGFLIGERFMREERPAEALKNFIAYAG